MRTILQYCFYSNFILLSIRKELRTNQKHFSLKTTINLRTIQAAQKAAIYKKECVYLASGFNEIHWGITVPKMYSSSVGQGVRRAYRGGKCYSKLSGTQNSFREMVLRRIQVSPLSASIPKLNEAKDYHIRSHILGNGCNSDQ